MSARLIAALLLAAAVIAFRLLPMYGGEELSKSLANISPLAALALCGGMLMPLRWAMPVAFGAFLVSDIALNLYYPGAAVLNWHSAILLLAFAAVFTIGWLLRRRASLALALGGALGGTLLFYLVTNTASFALFPGYPPTPAGWIQALTVGLPGLPPTWLFGLRSVLGNLVFAALFYLAMRPAVSAASLRLKEASAA